MSHEANLRPLIRADGSATFSSNLFTVIAGVNGPVEVQRRDELPEEAAIEVNIRPSSGVSGVKERWAESVVASLLRSVLLVHMHPRTLIQVTLQVTKRPSRKLKRVVEDVASLPALVNAAFLALVDAGLPLGKTISASLAAVVRGGTVVVEPTEEQLCECSSIHGMVYASAQGEMLLDESAGNFTLETWEEVEALLRKTCLAATAPSIAGEDEAMINGDAQDEAWLRRVLEEDVRKGDAWREFG